jgi:hypothetical protein
MLLLEDPSSGMFSVWELSRGTLNIGLFRLVFRLAPKLLFRLGIPYCGIAGMLVIFAIVGIVGILGVVCVVGAVDVAVVAGPLA